METCLIDNRVYSKVEKSKKDRKRPPSAFLLFSKDVRKKISQACPYFSPLDVSKVISEQWKTLPDAEKMRYREASLKLQEEENLKKMSAVPVPAGYIPAVTVQYIPTIKPNIIIEESRTQPLPSIASFGDLVTFKDLNYVYVTAN